MKNPFTRKRLRSLLRYLKYFLGGFLGTSVLLVLLFRFVPPVTSGVMIERRVESWFRPTPYQREYEWMPLERISPLMGVAVVAAEDQRFAEHAGFDWKAIEQAIAYNQRHRKTRGASTISQQTAKNLFLWSGRSWVRKGLEAYFTLLIEAAWPKERILEVYLNIIELGDGVYGVEAAAQHFFNKPAARLSSSEAALLAAVLPNPRQYDAGRPSSYVRGRQAWILNNMRRLGGSQYVESLDAPR